MDFVIICIRDLELCYIESCEVEAVSFSVSHTVTRDIENAKVYHSNTGCWIDCKDLVNDIRNLHVQEATFPAEGKFHIIKKH